jgi:hypothetical protein
MKTALKGVWGRMMHFTKSLNDMKQTQYNRSAMFIIIKLLLIAYEGSHIYNASVLNLE